jgi:hypothetical protein
LDSEKARTNREDGFQLRRKSVGVLSLHLYSFTASTSSFIANSIAFLDAYFRVSFLNHRSFSTSTHNQTTTMAEPEVVIDASENNTPAPTQSQDVEMEGQEENTQPENSADPSADQDVEPTGLENIEPEVPARVTFLE